MDLREQAVALCRAGVPPPARAGAAWKPRPTAVCRRAAPVFAVALAVAALALLVLAGCSASDIWIGQAEPPKINLLVKPVVAGTTDPITAKGTVIIGSVRADDVGGPDGMLVTDVPLEQLTSANAYVLPLTVTIRGYVTKMETLQFTVAEDREVQVELEEADLALTGTVTGKTVSSADSSPIAMAKVELRPDVPGEAPTISGGTDAEGGYIISGVPTGKVIGTASADKFLSQTQNTTVVQDEGGATTPALNFSLVPSDATAVVRGLVVRLGTQAPVPGATVTVGDKPPVTTDAKGQFEVAEVTVGDRELKVAAEGFIDHVSTIFVLPDMGQLRIELATAENQPPEPPATISGTVMITNRPDNSGATVEAIDLETLEVADTDVTDAAGRYGLFVPPGEYRINVTYETATISRTVTLRGGGRVLTGIDFAISAP